MKARFVISIVFTTTQLSRVNLLLDASLVLLDHGDLRRDWQRANYDILIDHKTDIPNGLVHHDRSTFVRIFANRRTKHGINGAGGAAVDLQIQQCGHS
jgi:hypothetical protein